jgi:glyoxylase-like metal-dependent hydrolase (beta-lactamase superfamily II)
VGGDMIIGGSIGRTDLPDSDHAQMEESLKKIMELPDDTQLLPGHGQNSTLGEERRTNYFLQSILES